MKTPKRSVSSAENSSIDYAKQYAYIEDIKDVSVCLLKKVNTRKTNLFLL